MLTVMMAALFWSVKVFIPAAHTVAKLSLERVTFSKLIAY